MLLLRLALVLTFLPAAALAQGPSFDPDTVRAGRLDNGKMWTFENPPVEYLAETYGFRPDAAWFERARLATLRLPGCTASFSPDGLVATNHHCAQGSVVEVSQEGEGLLDAGFYARTPEEERPVEGLYVDQLVAIEDVTAEMEAALAAAQTDAERQQASRAAAMAIQERLLAARGGEGAGFVVEVVGLYHGGRYSAYTFRRHTDLRLVFAPEQRLGYFGGDYDNFTYPRYALDFAFYRVYENGRPYQTAHYFPLSPTGVQEGDLVFVVGNPGSTSRGLTVAQLEFLRDVQVPTTLRMLDTRIAAQQAYLASGPENPDAVRSQLFGLMNSQKAFRGRLTGLRDPYILARRAAAERQFLADAPAAQTLIEEVAAVQAAKRAMADQYRLFATLTNRNLGAPLLLRGLAARDWLNNRSEEATTRLRATNDLPPLVARGYLAAQLEDLRAYYAAIGRPLPAILEGPSAEAVAERLLAGSALATSASLAAAMEANTLTADDPAVQLGAAFADDLAAFQSAAAGLSAREQDLLRRLGRLRYETYGVAVPPDATFSLRFTDGVVQGYEYNGTLAPPMTTLAGLFDRHYSFTNAGPNAPQDWTLPQRWLDAREDLDLSTPLNFTSTSDTIGGNSGSPVVTRDLTLVGLNFDRTIEGLVRDYVYLPSRGRNVMVDARAILHSLDRVYDADRLLEELREAQEEAQR